MQKVMLSSEFLEQIAAGRKGFEDMELHYADLDGHRFEGLRFRNCKFYFVMMRHCIFTDVVFEKCHMFFIGLRFSELENVQMIGCNIEYSDLSATFESSKMINTWLSWSDMSEAKEAGLEMINCTEFKIFRKVSDLTPDDLENAIAGLNPVINQLDFDMQQKVKVANTAIGIYGEKNKYRARNIYDTKMETEDPRNRR